MFGGTLQALKPLAWQSASVPRTETSSLQMLVVLHRAKNFKSCTFCSYLHLDSVLHVLSQGCVPPCLFVGR